jgi:DNA replication protein DnaC
MQASRADQSWERTLKRFTQPELLILDDFGLSTLTFSQAEDIYELIAERHLTSSFILTSNRKIEALVDLFPDIAMGNAVMDRLGSHSHPSCPRRQLLSPSEQLNKRLYERGEKYHAVDEIVYLTGSIKLAVDI